MISPDERITEDDVRSAYKIILCRDIDPGARDGWRHRLAQQSVSLKTLREELLRSEEYKSKWGSFWSEVDVGGVSVVVDRDEPEFGSFIAQHGQWESHIISLIGQELKQDNVFVDIGANVGMMSFHAARAVGPKGKVLAFEPKPENIQAFLRGLHKNNFTNVILYPFGVSNSTALFSLAGHSNAFLTKAGSDGAMAQCIPADNLLEAEPKIDFIKIDIEGHEPFAIEGLTRTIQKHEPSILCEFNPRCLHDHIGQEPIQFAKTLFDLGRSIEVVHPENDKVIRFFVSNADELMEIWSKFNAKAVSDNRLPDGMLHFDLLIRTERRSD